MFLAKRANGYVSVLIVTFLVLGIAISPGAARIAQAATFVIPNGDSAALITAISTANSTPGPDTIILATNGSYVLTQVVDSIGAGTGAVGLETITSAITIQGNGATISRPATAPEFRFFVTADVPANLTLNNLKLTGGIGTAPSYWGGAIYLGAGTAHLNNVSVFDNYAQDHAGGIMNNGAVVEIENSHIYNNGSIGSSAIFNLNGEMHIKNSTITGNSSLRPDTGSSNESTILNGETMLLEITNSTISNNFGTGVGNGGTLTLTNTTLNDNYATNGGGAMINSGTATVKNTAFTNNSTQLDIGVVGGAIYNTGAMDIKNSSFIGNNVGNGFGAAIYNAGSIALKNCSFVDNVGEGDDIYGIENVTIQNCVFDGVPVH